MAIIVAVNRKRRDGGNLVYVGRAGTGWDRKTATAIRRALESLARSSCPLAKAIKRADTIWVEPHYVAEVAYGEMTAGASAPTSAILPRYYLNQVEGICCDRLAGLFAAPVRRCRSTMD